MSVAERVMSAWNAITIKSYINLLRYEATIDDPGAYTAPWTVAWEIGWRPDGELMEYICQENNRYLYRLTDDFGDPVFGNR